MWMDRLRKSLAVVLVVALAVSMLALTGCGEKETDEEPKDEVRETIKIGVHTSLTGGLADYGFAAAEGLKLAAEDYSGFEIDGVVYDIELVIKDDKGEPAESPIVAQQLVDEGVVGVVGALTSGNTNAALPIYQEAGIPLISGSATNPDLTDGTFDNFFRTCLRDDVQGAAIAAWAGELGAKKAAIMDDRGDYAVGLANIVDDNLKTAGVETLRQEGQEGDVDFSAQVNSIKNFAPDIVIFTGYHREAGLLRKQLVEAGVDAMFMGGDGIKSDEIAAEAGGADNVEGIYATFGSPAREGMDKFPAFGDAFMEATSKEAGPYAENNYDALAALVAAMIEAQSVESADVLAALATVEVDGLVGKFSFDEKGDIAVPGASAADLIPRFEFKGGAWSYMG